MPSPQEMRGDHPDTYVVKRGDTLWDIPGRFLSAVAVAGNLAGQPADQESAPDLSGRRHLLAYLTASAAAGRPAQEAPINAIPLSDIEPYLIDLRVVDELPALPYVVGLEEDRLRSAAGQLVYVRAWTARRSARLRRGPPDRALHRTDPDALL